VTIGAERPDLLEDNKVIANLTAYTEFPYNNWWTVGMNSIKYGSTTLLNDASSAYAILDTGTSLITLPYEQFRAFT